MAIVYDYEGGFVEEKASIYEALKELDARLDALEAAAEANKEE